MPIPNSGTTAAKYGNLGKLRVMLKKEKEERKKEKGVLIFVKLQTFTHIHIFLKICKKRIQQQLINFF